MEEFLHGKDSQALEQASQGSGGFPIQEVFKRHRVVALRDVV